MLYKLPRELQSYIYSFDGTYKEKYNKTIDYINKLPEFISFDDEYGIYYFHKSGGGIHIFSTVNGTSYKDAFKKAIDIILLN